MYLGTFIIHALNFFSLDLILTINSCPTMLHCLYIVMFLQNNEASEGEGGNFKSDHKADKYSTSLDVERSLLTSLLPN